MMELYAVNVSGQLSASLRSLFMSLLTHDKQKSIQSFYRWEDAQRSLIAEVLIRYLARDKLGLSNEQMEFRKNAYGKPYLSQHPDFHYNLSHSEDWVVCAISSEAVGIDIERIKPIDLTIADRFFAKEEVEALALVKEVEKLDVFYELWTMKESYIKAAGLGLSIPLDSFYIQSHSNEVNTVHSQSNGKCYIRKYDLDKGYKLALCSANQTLFPAHFVVQKMDQLMTSKEEC